AGTHRVLHPRAQRRLVHDAAVLALQPVIPPAHALLEEADGGPRRAELGPGVSPRSDQALARAVESFQQARDGIRVTVLPATGGVDGTLDGGVVLAHRALPP